jgi:nucleotide-binding universal stress UspA family protein
VEQALEMARHEEMQLHGVHVVTTEAQRESAEVRAVRSGFEARLQAAGVAGRLAVVTGEVSRAICQRARWVDLVVLSLSHPPAARPLARLGSGFRTVLLRCPRPVLAVPAVAAPLRQAVLAYDGSPKAEEALFLATYLASRWGLSLAVVTSVDDEAVPARARGYLEAHGVAADYIAKQGPAAEVILRAAASHQADLVLMGGYGRGPVLEAVLGSTVDRVLRESRYAVLVSR